MNMKRLSGIEAAILELRWGMYVNSRQPCNAATKTSLITRERVKRIEAKARNRMALKRPKLQKN